MHICHICRHEVRQVHAGFLSDYPEKIAQTCKAIPHISSPCLGFFPVSSATKHASYSIVLSS